MAERALIACIIDDNDILYELDVTSSMMFWSEEREILKTIELIAKETKEIDIAIVHWRLKEELKDYFYDLVISEHISTRRKQYAMEIKEKHFQRKLIKAWNDIAWLWFEYSNIEKIKTIMSSMLMENIKKQDKSFLESFQETMDNLWKRRDIICNFWYHKLSNLKWYVEWNLIVIGARPKVGKSAFVLNLMKRVAEQNVKCALFSMEMNKTEISERFISMITATSSYRLDHLTEEEKGSIMKTASNSLLMLGNMEVIDNVNSADKIFNNIRKLSADWFKIFYIDYLQLIKWEWSNKNEMIWNITTWLKRLASELWIAIVILSQLNRDGAKWKPELHNLRDSWSIEQDANMVWFLNYDQDEPKALWIDVAANRSWPTFDASLTYIREFYSILD